MLSDLSVDFETPYGKDFSVVDLGYWKYARDERCVPYLISVCDGTESWAGEPKDFNFASLANRRLVSHNRPFDEEIALGAKERGLFEIPGLKPFGNDHWQCTLNMSAYLWNVRSLLDAAQVGLGVTLDKGVRDRAKDKTADDMKREGWWDDMLKYGLSDAQRCWELWDRHNHKWPEFERRLSNLTIDQGRHGLRIDIVALEQGIEQLQRIIFAATANLPWIARGRKPASPIGIAEECRLNNIPSPPVKAHNPDAAQEWEDLYAPQFKFVLALKNIRKAKKTLATLKTIKLRLRPDETIAFSLKYAGAHTLRWAGDSGFSLHNMAKEPMFIDPEYSFIFDKKKIKPLCDEFDAAHAGQRAHGELKSGTKFFDFRGLIIAREGMVLGPVDSAQIEPRVLNTIIGNTALLDQIRTGMAIYEAFARTSLGWEGGELKTQNKKLYSLSKSELLGLGFRMGWEKFIDAAWTLAGVDITEGDEDFAKAASVDGKIYTRWKVNVSGEVWQYGDDAVQSFGVPALGGVPTKDCEQQCVFVKQLRRKRGAREMEEFVGPLQVYGMRSRVTVKQFRENNPLNVEIWEKFDRALDGAVGGDLTVEGPHGGCLIYRDVRHERREQKNKETGEKYLRTVCTALIGGKRYILHGGVLTENLVQWVARMVFAERALDLHDRLRAEDPRQGVLFTVHDEAVPEILDPGEKKEERRKWLEAVLSVAPAWFKDCPLAAEAKIVSRYLK